MWWVGRHLAALSAWTEGWRPIPLWRTGCSSWVLAPRFHLPRTCRRDLRRCDEGSPVGRVPLSFGRSSVGRVTNDLSEDLESVVGFVRQAITSSKTILTPYDDSRPDSYAMAGLAHCCVLLEELENLRAEGNDLVAVLVGRACLETWLTARAAAYARPTCQRLRTHGGPGGSRTDRTPAIIGQEVSDPERVSGRGLTPGRPSPRKKTGQPRLVAKEPQRCGANVVRATIKLRTKSPYRVSATR